MITTTDLVGYCAAFLTTSALFPQVVLTLRTRDTKSLSLMMYGFTALGVGLWLCYGILKGDAIIMTANSCTLIFALIILSVKIQNILTKKEFVQPTAP
ncbi:MAG: SemiSWEET family sugar transporter [Sumerlaeia bacterium]